MKQDICVIIPTVREYRAAIKSYTDNAESHGFDKGRMFFLIVTEDFVDKNDIRKVLKECGVEGEVLGEKERTEWFEENGVSKYSKVIPKRSHAETSFGLLYMLPNKGFRYGFFIDDDTSPVQDFDYFGDHLKNLEHKGSMETVTSDNRWVNVLHHNSPRTGLYPRGYPYGLMGEKVRSKKEEVKDVVLSQGLWTNMPDLDAIRIVINGNLDGVVGKRLGMGDFTGSFCVGKGNYTTICSMNLAFKREIIPAFYQLPMDDNQWKVGRFDDIWSGVIIKKLCDVLGKDIINGYPLCSHDKAKRSTFKDLVAEVNGLEINEHLWEMLEGMGLNGRNFTDLYESVAENLSNGTWKYVNGEFLNYMGRMMKMWIECVKSLR